MKQWCIVDIIDVTIEGGGIQMRKLRVLFVASEAVPFAKTGGLADVIGSLPQALKKQEIDARVALPY